MADSTSNLPHVSSDVVLHANIGVLQYHIKPDKRFKARANIYFNLKACDVIKEDLPKEKYDELLLSSVGLVLKQGTKLRFDFQLVHHLLMHEVETLKKREMWFKLSGSLTRFSIAEFSVASGLPCSNSSCGPPDFVSMLDFFGQRKVSYAELEQMFISEPASSGKKIIMARLLLVEQVIHYRSSKSVDPLYLSLACDPEKFDKYNWGRLSYDSLFSSLKKCAVKGWSVKDLEDRVAYDMQDYALTFQIWILEVAPNISNSIACSFRIHHNDPFSLHWQSSVSLLYDQCKEIFAKDMEVMFPT